MITSILTVYNRPHLLEEQIQAIKEQTLKSDIMIWNNLGDNASPEIIDKDIIIAKCSHNLKFYSRFAFALNAQTEYVAIFDDDTIPGKRWFENCLTCIKQKPGIYGTIGVKLIGNDYRKRTRCGWVGNNTDIQQVHLVGHAWFMRTDYLRYLWFERPISFDNGEDIQLSYMAKKYGGINTYVPPHPITDKELWGSIKGKEYGHDGNGSFSVNKEEHKRIRNIICRKFLKAGWEI